MVVYMNLIKVICLVMYNFFFNAFDVNGPFRFSRACALFTVVFSMTFAPLSSIAETPVLMVLGDSLVAGHGLPQGKTFPDTLGKTLKNNGIDVKMINAGVSGDTTAGGRARLDWSLADDPDAVIIVLGGNDLLRGLEPSTSYANLDNIIKRLKANDISVLLAGMRAPRNLGSEYANEFDAIYRKLVENHDILFYPFFLDGVALRTDLNQSDGMHPNQAGVKIITEKILPYVKALLKRKPK